MQPLFNSQQRTISILLLLLCCGCGGPPVGEVAGKVTLDGKPLTDASIVFENAEKGISVSAKLGADGDYKASTYDKPGLAPGTYGVAVRAGAAGDGSTPLVGEEPGKGSTPAEIPKKYQSVATSGLSAEVKEGTNPPFVFALESGEP